MNRVLRSPLLHFFAIGGVLFALDGASGPELAPAFEPGGEVTRELVADEALLVREARALGHHRTDPLVRRRLVRNMRFLGDDPERSEAALFEEALALGMDRSDPVVRRRLAQIVTLGIEAAARDDDPDEIELEAYLARHTERFAEPARVRISHVFLSRDRRGEALETDAQALLARLVRDGISPDRAAELGDPLLLGAAQPPRSEAELDRTFGEGFSELLAGAAPGAWIGPVASSYGLHVVWVHERHPARVPGLDAVRGAVREALLADRAELAVREALRALRDRGRA